MQVDRQKTQTQQQKTAEERTENIVIANYIATEINLDTKEFASPEQGLAELHKHLDKFKDNPEMMEAYNLLKERYPEAIKQQTKATEPDKAGETALVKPDFANGKKAEERTAPTADKANRDQSRVEKLQTQKSDPKNQGAQR